MTPDFDWAVYLKAIGLAVSIDLQRHRSQPSTQELDKQLKRRSARRHGRPTCAGTLVHSRRAVPVDGLRRRELRLLPQDASRRAGAASALEALRRATSTDDLGEALGQEFVEPHVHARD